MLNGCVHRCCQFKIHCHNHKITWMLKVICVCGKRTIRNYEKIISGRSNRNISLLAGVRSLRKYRNDGGPFRTNLISAFCGRGSIFGITNCPGRFRNCPGLRSFEKYVAFLMETFRKTLLLHFQKRNLLEYLCFFIFDNPLL